ncbi:MAG TPA: hypothetical protein VGW38_13275, partial [Chloroflexota bacterium]|nr:hypothetical protein [Chloroflexota bacterium]
MPRKPNQAGDNSTTPAQASVRCIVLDATCQRNLQGYHPRLDVVRQPYFACARRALALELGPLA